MEKFELKWLFYYICANTETLQQCHWTDSSVYYSSTKTEGLKKMNKPVRQFTRIQKHQLLIKAVQAKLKRYRTNRKQLASTIFCDILDSWLYCEETYQRWREDYIHPSSHRCTQKHTLWGNSGYSATVSQSNVEQAKAQTLHLCVKCSTMHRWGVAWIWNFTTCNLPHVFQF